MRYTRTIVVAALLAAIVPAAGARAAGPTANPPGMKRLSDERTLSRWAYPNNHARVRSRPTGHARFTETSRRKGTSPAIVLRPESSPTCPRY